MSAGSAAPLKVVGKRVPRVDAAERVTGRALYAADLVRPGMIVGRIKRSPHAHARIVAIDISKARALKGVLAVVTGADFATIAPGTMYPFGETGADAWISAIVTIARDRVLWRGHAVAAVAAVDGHVAEQALALIDVTYEPLPAAMSIEAAMASDAPFICPEVKPKGFDVDALAPRNAATRTLIVRGDVDGSFKSAAASAEVAVSVDTAHQGYIEPHVCVAETDGNGVVTLWASTQGTFATELQCAHLLGLPQSKIKTVPMEVGGAFGGKITVHVEPVAMRLAQLSGRPVKIVTTREEILSGGSGPAAAARIRTRISADTSGKITAIDGHFMLDTGGLPGTPTTLMMQAAAAPYQCANLRLEGLDVLTNKPRTESYRGPGGIQAAFALEQTIDELVLKLNMDPLNFRQQNASVTGSLMPVGTPFPPIAFEEILDSVAAHPCWTEPLAKGALPRGRGLAVGYWRGTSMTSAAHVTVSGDGRPVVTMGAVDISGIRVSMAQVAAEEFGLGVDDVLIVTGDSKSAGYTDIAAGSRVARTMAAAVSQACQDALAQISIRAAEKLQCRADELTFRDAVFWRGTDGASITLSQVMGATLTEGAIIGRGVSTKLPYGVEAGAHVCDLEVDPDTGQVTILRYTAFQDVGRALNPPAVEGQIEGSVAQGLGWALTEAFDYAPDGRLRNASLLDYRMPTALDLPKIDTVILECPVPGVPYGVRGVGEMPIVPVAACVGNALRRALGIRLTEMPMTPERIRAAIKRHGNIAAKAL